MGSPQRYSSRPESHYEFTTRIRAGSTEIKTVEDNRFVYGNENLLESGLVQMAT